MFTIYSTCIANTEEKSGRSCNVDKCFLEIEDSKTLEKERYKDKIPQGKVMGETVTTRLKVKNMNETP